MTEYNNELHEQLNSLATNICDIIAGIQLQECAASAPPIAAHSGVGGCIHINGAWNGSIFVYYSENIANQMVAAMVPTRVAPFKAEDRQDVLGEVLNMIAGNMKVLLPGPGKLSLPHVAQGKSNPADFDGGNLQWLTYESNGDHLWLSIQEGETRCKIQ